MPNFSTQPNGGQNWSKVPNFGLATFSTCVSQKETQTCKAMDKQRQYVKKNIHGFRNVKA
jgi:hypothetical protein